MTKKIILAIAVMLTMGFAANAQKFGVVSAEEIVQNMQEFKEVQTMLAEASKQYEDEYGKLQQELEKKYTEYQELEKDAATPQGIKERRIQEISDLDRKAQQFAQTAQQDLQRQQMQLMTPVQEKLMQAIKTVGANNGFIMVFPAELPLYIDPLQVTDITPLVKAELGIQ